MESLTMENLKNNFKTAIEDKHKYVGVLIQMEGFAKPEIIINQIENFETKLAYYIKAYNDDLTLKTFNGIKIIGFTYGDIFEDIEVDLIGLD